VSTEIGAPSFNAALIASHSSTVSWILTLFATDSVESPSALWFAHLLMFSGLIMGLLLSSNSSDESPMIAYT
jgi:hypothetical protein